MAARRDKRAASPHPPTRRPVLTLDRLWSSPALSPVRCPACGTSLSLHALDHHLDSTCPSAPLPPASAPTPAPSSACDETAQALPAQPTGPPSPLPSLLDSPIAEPPVPIPPSPPPPPSTADTDSAGCDSSSDTSLETNNPHPSSRAAAASRPKPDSVFPPSAAGSHPLPYYVRDFWTMVDGVRGQLPPLLEPQQVALLETLAAASSSAQALFVRIYNRKPRWFRLRSLQQDYADALGSAQVVEAAHELARGGLCTLVSRPTVSFHPASCLADISGLSRHVHPSGSPETVCAAANHVLSDLYDRRLSHLLPEPPDWRIPLNLPELAALATTPAHQPTQTLTQSRLSSKIDRDDFVVAPADQLDLSTALRLLSGPELRDLARQLAIPKSLLTECGSDRDGVVSALLRHAASHRTLLGSGVQSLSRSLQPVLGACVSVAAPLALLLEQITVAFFLTETLAPGATGSSAPSTACMFHFAATDRTPLAASVRLVHPSTHPANHVLLPAFRSHFELAAFHRALAWERYVLAALPRCTQYPPLEASVAALLPELVQVWHAVLREGSSTAAQSDSSIRPVFLASFSPAAPLTRIVDIYVDLLEKRRAHADAIVLLRQMIGQSHVAMDCRGRWYDRLALIIERHANDFEDAHRTCFEGLMDEHVRTGHRWELFHRMNRIARRHPPLVTPPPAFSPTLWWLRHMELLISSPSCMLFAECLARGHPDSSAGQAVEVDIPERFVRAARVMHAQLRTAVSGKSLHSGRDETFAETARSASDHDSRSEPANRPRGERLWLRSLSAPKGADGVFEAEGDSDRGHVVGRVEDIVLNELRHEGYSGTHGEGAFVSTLFVVLLWDVVFAPIPGVFFSPLQTAPLDLWSDSFWRTRRDSLAARLAVVAASARVAELFRESWEAHVGLVCFGAAWALCSLAEWESALDCLGSIRTARLLAILASDYRHSRGGVPDLAVWRPRDKDFRFIEVKSRRDRLSPKQKVWLQVLVHCEIPVELARVEQIEE
jgi:hypothetical protein